MLNNKHVYNNFVWNRDENKIYSHFYNYKKIVDNFFMVNMSIYLFWMMSGREYRGA